MYDDTGCFQERSQKGEKQLGFNWTDFHEICFLNIFRKYEKIIQVSLKSGKNNVRVIYMKTNIYF
jgi:hypothetical protein